jgi:hypothetical protein
MEYPDWYGSPIVTPENDRIMTMVVIVLVAAAAIAAIVLVRRANKGPTDLITSPN